MATTPNYLNNIFHSSLTQQKQETLVPAQDQTLEWRKKVTVRINEDKKAIDELKEEVERLKKIVEILLKKQFS